MKKAKAVTYTKEGYTGDTYRKTCGKVISYGKTIDETSQISKTITKLTSGKKYYVRMRTYKVVNGKKQYSAWSTVKNVKVK